MSTTDQHRVELSVLTQLRRFGFGRNPLRRRVDRLESALLLGVLVAALLVIPAATALGTTVHNRAEHTAAQQRTALHSVQARTLENTAEVVPSTPGEITTRVRASWFDASGSPHVEWADVLIGTKAGTELTIWLDRTGAMARPPRDSADSAALGVAAGVAIPMVAWPLLWAFFRRARLRLDCHCAQEWAREWEQVAPRWTRPKY